MPVTQDALNLATIHLLPTLEDNFFDDHVMLKKFIMGGVDKRKSGGEYAAFDVVVDGPGSAVKIMGGGEAYSYGRRNITRQGRVYIPTHIYAYAVEGEAMRHAHGETGIKNLLQLYPEKAMKDLQQRIVSQVLVGNQATANLDGFCTLNGDTTYNPDGTALNGLFDFAALAAQNQTVESLMKQSGVNGVTGWYNQYGNVTSFATNGKSTMRQVYSACQMRAGTYGTPDLGITDSISLNNYYDSLDDQVRYASAIKGEEGRDMPEGLMFHSMPIFVDVAMDDGSASFGHTTNGTMYFINTKTFFILTLGGDSEYETKGFFDVRGPFKLEGRDAWGWEIVTAFQPACRYLKANGCLEGTAIA